MSEVSEMIQRYKEVRERLRNPPNAVPDPGINLRASRPQAAPKIQETTESQSITAESAPTETIDIPAFLPPMKYITLTSTISIAAAEFGFTYDDFKSRTRIRALTFPRQIAIYLATKQERWSCAWIGRALGLDHTTVLYARDKIASLIETDEELKNKVLAIEGKILALRPSATPAHNKPHLDEDADGNVPEPILSYLDQGG